MKRLKTKKNVVIYHPTTLIVEKGSILRCNHIFFGVFNNKDIMNETTHPDAFAECFEELTSEEIVIK